LRLQEIADRLGPFANARLEVKSADSVQPALGAPVITGAATAAPHPPVLQSWLQDSFPDPKQREQFTRTTFRLARETSKQVEALRVLAVRYPEAEWNRLTPADAESLRAVVDGLRGSFWAGSAELTEHVSAIAGIPLAGRERPAEAWRCVALDGSDAMRHANHALLVLFTSNAAVVAGDASAISELQAALRALNQTTCAN
jgi:hypothetical protein